MSAAEPSTSVATASTTDSTAPPKRTGSGLAPEFSNQVGGHSGSFAKTITGDIWKVRARRNFFRRSPLAPGLTRRRRPQLTDEPERYMLELLNQTHDLRHLVPRYSKEIELSRWEGKAPGKDDVCIEMQDVTAEFGEHPCIMDVKVGIRTFLEDEVTNQKIREDLLKKMDKIDKSAATAAERASVRRRPPPPRRRRRHAPPPAAAAAPRAHPPAAPRRSQGGITKLRYMQWREQMSSSATLGFRVEGIKVWAAEEGAAEGSGASQVTEIGKEALSTENDEETVLARLRTFVHNDYKLARLYLERLTAIRSALSASALFMQHQARAAAAQFSFGTEILRRDAAQKFGAPCC